MEGRLGLCWLSGMLWSDRWWCHTALSCYWSAGWQSKHNITTSTGWSLPTTTSHWWVYVYHSSPLINPCLKELSSPYRDDNSCHVVTVCYWYVVTHILDCFQYYISPIPVCIKPLITKSVALKLGIERIRFIMEKHFSKYNCVKHSTLHYNNRMTIQ